MTKPTERIPNEGAENGATAPVEVTPRKVKTSTVVAIAISAIVIIGVLIALIS
jgi:hypothetical protein